MLTMQTMLIKFVGFINTFIHSSDIRTTQLEIVVALKTLQFNNYRFEDFSTFILVFYALATQGRTEGPSASFLYTSTQSY